MRPDVLVVVGARPNFVKVAPVVSALRENGVTVRLLHTGQHYDAALSEGFFAALSLPPPDVFLGVGSGTHAEQTAGVMVGVERELLADRPRAVVVAGDVNSTLAAALAAAKLEVPLVHIESGLRSHDWAMPEEINRVLTDRLSGLLLCPGADAAANLQREGIAPDRIAVVGNTMIDSLQALLPAARASDACGRHGVTPSDYVLVTLHRPALVDDEPLLTRTLDVLGRVAAQLPVLLPLHPRTSARVQAAGYTPPESLRLMAPLDYLDFIALESEARLVVTDSGGVQEETTVLGVPCLTYRSTTERPITITEGTNRLVGLDPENLARECEVALARPRPSERPAIALWDGSAGFRAAQSIATFLARLEVDGDGAGPPPDLARTT